MTVVSFEASAQVKHNTRKLIFLVNAVRSVLSAS